VAEFIINVTLFAFGIILTGMTLILTVVKFRMHSKAIRLKKEGIHPAGSTIVHGMVRDGDRRGVIPDSQESRTWYARLL